VLRHLRLVGRCDSGLLQELTLGRQRGQQLFDFLLLLIELGFQFGDIRRCGRGR
jgi:hypothetical protein